MNAARDSESIGERIFENGQVYPDIGGREVGGRVHFFFEEFEKCYIFSAAQKIDFSVPKKSSVMQ